MHSDTPPARAGSGWSYFGGDLLPGASGITCSSSAGDTEISPLNGRECAASRSTAIATLVANNPMMIRMPVRFSL